MKEKFDIFSVNSRICVVMRMKGHNKNSLSKLLDISQPAMKKIEDNENLPSFKLLFNFISLFDDISAEWLLTGQGEMLKTEEPRILSIAPNSKQIDILIETNAELVKTNSALVKMIKK